MDETVNAAWRTLWLVLAACAAPAGAQGMVDPTQPPSGLVKPAASGPDGSKVAEPASAQLQSILISNKGRRVAVIDGISYRIGEQYNGATVKKITETQVVLQSGKQTQVMTLSASVTAPAVASVPSAKGEK